MTPTERAAARLPRHLRRYVVDQEHAAYTPRDHAVWRHILRRMVDQVRDTAHPSYLHGLEATGIGTEAIPTLDEMNERLDRLGWSAVGVRGFVPPEVFVELQARRTLAIAADIRTHQHVLYTPAPDIVHESAGHAPILADARFADYLQRVGEVGHRAIAAREDWTVFQAVRALSAAKEDPASTPEQLAAVEEALHMALRARRYVSESARASRLYWWTAEYGLVGDLDRPRIYGAGLLSSLGESARCLGADVARLPLTLACVDVDFDITTMQPQLFVARDFDQLFEVVDAFEATLSWRRGGDHGLHEALRAGTVNHLTLEGGLQVTGVVSAVHAGSREVAPGLRSALAVLDGPVALARDGLQVAGPREGAALVAFGEAEPVREGPFERSFASGLRLSGRMGEGGWADALEARVDGRPVPVPGRALLLSARGLPSVAGGAADRAAWDEAVGPPPGIDGHVEAFARIRKARALPDALAALYLEVRAMRESGRVDPRRLQRIRAAATAEHPDDWLLTCEVDELLAGEA